jgi:Cu(I)/Ag(I) efflux system membrane fusion protein
VRLAIVALVIVTAAIAAAAGGYWFAHHRLSPPPTASDDDRARSMAQHDHAPPPTATAPAERKILYYRDPMGRPEFSAVPKKDEMGMDYIPVYEDEEESLEPAAPASTSAHDHHHHGAQVPPALPSDRKIVYYRNPMGLPDTSPVPKKDSMGMDYIPVYADEATDDSGVVRVSPARVQMLGVRTEPVARRALIRPVRAVGTVRFSERQMSVVSTKFEGWIEKLYVNATGEAVQRGEPLMRVYSPLLVQTQQEYVTAAQLAESVSASDAESSAAAKRLVEGALQRLRFLDFPEVELRRLVNTRQVSRSIAVPAPSAGIVLEKMAFEGMRISPGEPLYRLAGVSPIWVIAEVFEQDVALVALGQPAAVTVKAYPGRSFQGRVAFIYPMVNEVTRTATLRIELPNPAGELKAEMYASVELAAPVTAAKVLSVPDSAVIDNGVRQVVLVDRGEGRFEPRAIRIGAKADGYTEVREGVADGDKVVISANFLIDAESNLKAALGAFSAGGHQH